MGRAAWHGFVCFYRSNDLTFASSVAFYALLSLFPFLLLSLSVLGRVSADDHDRAAILGFVLQYFPRQFDFVTVQLDAFRQSKTALEPRRQRRHGVGRARVLRRDHERHQLRLPGQAVRLLEAQAGVVPDAGRGRAC